MGGGPLDLKRPPFRVWPAAPPEITDYLPFWRDKLFAQISEIEK